MGGRAPPSPACGRGDSRDGGGRAAPGAAAEAGGEGKHHIANTLQHRLGLSRNVVIPKMQHRESWRPQKGVPPRICFAPVLSAIGLDHQVKLQADEIDDVGTDRLLTLELQTHEALGPQVIPGAPLRIRLLRTQGLGALQQPFPLPNPSPTSGRGAQIAPLFHVSFLPPSPMRQWVLLAPPCVPPGRRRWSTNR
jgi:hypothetical protein